MIIIRVVFEVDGAGKLDRITHTLALESLGWNMSRLGRLEMDGWVKDGWRLTGSDEINVIISSF